MALTIPDIQSITNGTNGFDFQAVSDSTDIAALQAAIDGAAYVLTGMGVSPSSGMTVAVASGTYVVGGAVFAYAGGTVTASAADASDRRDIVTINAAGTVSVTKGTDCGTAGWVRTSSGLPPVKPAIPSGGVLLGELAVTSTTTTLASANIVDKTTIGGANVQAGTVVKTTQSTTTTGAVALTGLAFNIAASEVVQFTAYVPLVCSSTSTRGGAKFAVTAPSGATGNFVIQGPVASGATTSAWTSTTSFGSLLGPYVQSTSVEMVSIEGTIVNSTTAGTVGIQFAANTTTVTVTIESGSSIVAFPI